MVGQNIGKYRVLDRIGRGGMGTVYRAIDETLHREVAIKVLNAELNDPAVARRFRAEAVTVARLNHPGIATVYELFQHEGEWLMVMEFVRGETLEALVARKGPLGADEASELCMQALSALAHAHSLGVVHRDLKPANVMVGESGIVKIMDFGIARVVGTEHLTSAGFMMGTPAYMAPEQVLGEDIDARADLYALGVVLFYLLTAKLPFKGTSPFEMARSRLQDTPTALQSVRPELPAWVDHVIDVALQRDVGKRYQSAPVFREALKRGIANLPQETPVAVVVPPELIATAAPGSMPVLAAPSVTAQALPGAALSTTPAATPPALPPVDVMTPTAPTPSAPVSVPVPAPAATRPASPPVAGARNSNPVFPAMAAALVLAAGVGGWMWLRSGVPAVPQGDELSAAMSDAPPAPSVPAPAPAPPPVEAPASAAPAVTAPPVAAPVPPAVTAATGSPASASVAASGRSAAPARGTSSPPAAAPVDPLVSFKDIRVLVVSGKKAEERPVVLNFGDGQISAVLERDGTTVRSMPYREISYAVYTRAKDPKWSVVLASPPADVDLPGGLFRSARRWLTIQSRADFLMFRLNDADWRHVLETVTARTGVAIEQTPGSE